MNEVVVRATQLPASAGKTHVDDDARAKRLAAVRALRKANRWKPLKFVTAALVAWWLLAVLADLVITCVPGGAPCRAYSWAAGFWRIVNAITGNVVVAAGGSGAAGLTRYDWVLLLLALVAALWVAKAYVYPAADGADEFTEDELAGKA